MPPIIKEFLPSKSVNVPVSYIVSAIILLLSLGMGYGAFKSNYDNTSKDVSEAKQQIVQLRTDLTNLTVEMGRLRQSMEDLKGSLDRKR